MFSPHKRWGVDSPDYCGGGSRFERIKMVLIKNADHHQARSFYPIFLRTRSWIWLHGSPYCSSMHFLRKSGWVFSHPIFLTLVQVLNIAFPNCGKWQEWAVNLREVQQGDIGNKAEPFLFFSAPQFFCIFLPERTKSNTTSTFSRQNSRNLKNTNFKIFC